MDSDFHKIFYSGEWINGDAEIEIEDNVWIGARTTILKGTRIAYGSVVAANSVVAKSLSTAKALYAGNPATLKKESIEWGV
jgi:acetyltransferase-like isoleucine patch superfamily enzyme